MPTWTHTFVCLSDPDHDSPLDYQEKGTLQLAGLGEKRFACSTESDAQDFSNDMIFQFPKLADGGGFELLQMCESGSKELKLIECPVGGYTVEYLKAVVDHAKVYIRPLQKKLDMSPSANVVSTSYKR